MFKLLLLATEKTQARAPILFLIKNREMNRLALSSGTDERQASGISGAGNKESIQEIVLEKPACCRKSGSEEWER